MIRTTDHRGDPSHRLHWESDGQSSSSLIEKAGGHSIASSMRRGGRYVKRRVLPAASTR